MKLALLSPRRWLPWCLATVPALIALGLPVLFSYGDLRSSGQMTLVALTLACFSLILLSKRPWQARTMTLRSLGTATLLVLTALSVVGVVEGTPELLQEQFGLFVGLDDYGPRSIFATPAGYVVVGNDAAKNAVIWLSEDTQSWSRVSHSDVLENLEIGDGAYTEFGIMMVGQDEKTKAPVALLSPEAATWRRVGFSGNGIGGEDAAKPKALAHDGPNLVLIGSTYGNDSVFWYANEPGVWFVGEPKPVFDRGNIPVDVVAIEGGFLAAIYSENDNPEKGAVLTASETGRSWMQITSFPDGEFSSVASYQKGAVAVGYDRSTKSAAVWVSTDGALWRPAPQTGALEHGRIDIVATDGHRLLAFGRDFDGLGVVWSSKDAMDWERLPVAFGEVLFRDAIMTDSNFVAVGLDIQTEEAAFWTSKNGTDWRRVSDDGNLFTVR